MMRPSLCTLSRFGIPAAVPLLPSNPAKMPSHAAEVDQHESNKLRLTELESQLDETSQVHSYGADLSNLSPSPGNGSQTSSDKLSSALFNRKPKKKSKGKSGSSTPKSVREQVEEIKHDEKSFIKSHHRLFGEKDPQLEADEQNVVDLADHLLEELDLRDKEAAALGHRSSEKSSVSSHSSNQKHSHHSLTSFFRSDDSNQPKKPSRQQARLQRRDAAAAEASENARNEVDPRNANLAEAAEAERQDMVRICGELHADMHEVQPDGHCLFAALADQLNIHHKSRNQEDYQTLRRATADYMAAHPDDFSAFLTPDDNHFNRQNHDGLMSPEEYTEYCREIRETAAWGGQIEITAISRIYKTPVQVYQALTPVCTIGEEFQGQDPLRISYHRHMYGLGEVFISSLLSKLK